MNRAQANRAIAELHRAWALQHGDSVPYVAADASGPKSDLAIWQAERSAPAELQDDLNHAIMEILAGVEDDPDEPAAVVEYRIHGRPEGGLPLAIATSEIDLTRVQDQWERQLAKLLSTWKGITQDQIDEIADRVRSAVYSNDVAAIAALSTTSANAAAALIQAMNEMAFIAAEEVVRAARVEQVHLEPVGGDPNFLAAISIATAALLAAGLANSGAREALRRYGPGVSGDQVSAAVKEHLRGLSDAFLESNLGNALTSAQNNGRLETYKTGPEVALYASEVLDGNTCKPCQHVDGRWLGNLSNMDMVYATYPNGGYVDCEGGPRCRGTIVAVYRPETVVESTEAA